MHGLPGCLAVLPESQRAVVELVAVDGLTVAEAAQALGITAGNARARVVRVVQVVRLLVRLDGPADRRVVRGRPRPPGLLLGGAVFALCGLVPLWRVPGARRETSADRETDATVVEPGPAPAVPAAGPWPMPAVAQAPGNALQGSGYRVEFTPRRIRVDVDIVDTSWWVLATKRGFSQAYAVQLLMLKPGRVIRSDASRRVTWREACRPSAASFGATAAAIGALAIPVVPIVLLIGAWTD